MAASGRYAPGSVLTAVALYGPVVIGSSGTSEKLISAPNNEEAREGGLVRY